MTPYLYLAASFAGTPLIDSGLPERLRDVAANLLSSSRASQKSVTDADIRTLNQADVRSLIEHLGRMARDRPSDLLSGVAAILRVAKLTDAASVAKDALMTIPAKEIKAPLVLLFAGDDAVKYRAVLERWKAGTTEARVKKAVGYSAQVTGGKLMGTSGAYTGAGGKAGKDVRDGLSDWLDSLPAMPGDGDSTRARTELKNATSRSHYFRQRSLAGSWICFGLDQLEVAQVTAPAPAEVEAASRPGGAQPPGEAAVFVRARADRRNVSRPSVAELLRAPTRTPAEMRQDCSRWASTTANSAHSTIRSRCRVESSMPCAVSTPTAGWKEAEERYVAASVAGWVLEQSEDGELPDLDDVARYVIAMIVAEVLSSELGETLRDRPDEVADIAEDELREAALVLAQQAELSTPSPTEDELAKAIEEGLGRLRFIYGDGS